MYTLYKYTIGSFNSITIQYCSYCVLLCIICYVVHFLVIFLLADVDTYSAELQLNLDQCIASGGDPSTSGFKEAQKVKPASGDHPVSGGSNKRRKGDQASLSLADMKSFFM